MTGHRHVGQMPVHRRRRQNKTPVDGGALRLVDRRRVAVIKGLVTIDRYGHLALPILRLRLAVKPNLYCVRRDGDHLAQHAILDAEITIVLQEDDAIAARKGSLPIAGLVTEFLTFIARRVGALCQLTAILQPSTNAGIDGTDVVASMGHRNARVVGIGRSVSDVIGNDRLQRFLAICFRWMLPCAS